MKRGKTQKGITLVALIITIIVLLILAVVAIRAVTGDGIIAHAKNARDQYEQKATEENTLLSNLTGYITGQIGESSGGGTIPPDSSEETGKVAYTIGQKVMVGTEKFYVIADSDETQDKVTLLAFENIDTTNLVQSTSEKNVAFSSENYWGEGTLPYDIVEPEIIPASHIAAKAAYDYGAKVGGTGRLMTNNEAIALVSTNSAMMYGTETESENGYLNYWLGSAAYSTDMVLLVLGGGNRLNDCIYTLYDYCGVRPVVEILKSKVSIAP